MSISFQTNNVYSFDPAAGAETFYRAQQAEESNPRLALDLYKQAADQGDPEALATLALAYTQGILVPKNTALAAEAARRCMEAAEKGDVKAMMFSKSLAEEGYGIQKDPREARKWDQQAKAAGAPTCVIL